MLFSIYLPLMLSPLIVLNIQGVVTTCYAFTLHLYDVQMFDIFSYVQGPKGF